MGRAAQVTEPKIKIQMKERRVLLGEPEDDE
jgi:hypothetical protein